jgi:ATP-dependent exoDNAse (exonuclease V) beta subunit
MGSPSAITAWGSLEVLPPATAEALTQWQALANALLTEKGAVRKKIDKNSGFPPQSPLKSEMLETLERCSGLPELVNALRGIGDLPGSGYPDGQWAILEALIDVLPIAAAQLRIVLGSRGETDFPEVAANALQALGSEDEPSDLGLALDIRISHILVDEFQDTSAAQFMLLEKLVAGWQPDDGRTLFLVGDPMQSIYRFREADVRLFLRVHRGGIGGLRPDFLQLRENFRSDPSLVYWCNTIFDQILPAVDDLEFGGSSFAPSDPALPTGRDAAVEVHWRPATRGGEGSARDVVTLVCALHRNSPEEGICILVRNRNHAVPILRGLRAAGIGFLAPDMEGLAKSPVAQDLLCLTRALCHRGDRLAWLALLRAPWCGLKLADLHMLAAADRGRDVWDLMHDDDLVGHLGPESRGRLLRVRELLAEPMRFRGRLSLRDLVEAAWLRLNGPATAAEPADLQTAGSFLTELDSFDRGGDLADEAALAECLAGMTASLGGADTRVQVMTIHKAKGLEFDTVILPALERGQKHTETRLLLWHDPAAGSGDEPTILAPAPATSGGEDSLYPVLQKFERRKDQLEQQRLLYVACTRARKRLHLFGELRPSRAQGQPGVLPPKTNSLLAHLWIAVQQDAEASASGWEQPDAPAAEEDPWVQLQLRRLPADWEPPAVAACFVSAPGHGPGAGTPPPEFDWAGRWAMHAGAVVHRWLHLFGERGPEQFPAPASEPARAAFRRMLERLGTEQRSLEPGTERVVQALTRTLADERGRWILSRDHRNAASELALTVVDGASTRQVVIDRTFVTADGDRWIIDFKTSTHEGGDLNAFLESESARYREQLAGYRRALTLAGEERVRTALYFPLLGEFREIGFEASDVSP